MRARGRHAEYQIITDATADFAGDMGYELAQVQVVPMEVTVGRDRYLYGPEGDLQVQRFYAMQRAGAYASTSQINPPTYWNVFEQALKQGRDVLYLGFSSGMSGTVDNARACMEQLRCEYPQRRIVCYDTLAASAGEGFLVREAVRRQLDGMSMDDMLAWLDENRLRVCHWFTVDTFDHLRHGGRVSSVAAAAGNLLNIKPMLHVDQEGRLEVVKKLRGRRKAMHELLAVMEEGWQPERGRQVVVAHGDVPEAAETLRQMIADRFPEAELHTAQIGPVIGAHTGPGMMAVLYWGSNR
ncbi:MAG: DegV family protein [Aristaeellaceae bacterium]